MRCPNCNSENTRLSWLKEQAVVFWCTPCHSSFDINRADFRRGPASRPATTLPTELKLAS